MAAQLVITKRMKFVFIHYSSIDEISRHWESKFTKFCTVEIVNPKPSFPIAPSPNRSHIDFRLQIFLSCMRVSVRVQFVGDECDRCRLAGACLGRLSLPPA